MTACAQFFIVISQVDLQGQTADLLRNKKFKATTHLLVVTQDAVRKQTGVTHLITTADSAPRPHVQADVIGDDTDLEGTLGSTGFLSDLVCGVSIYNVKVMVSIPL